MIFPADSGFGRLQGCCSAFCGVLKLWAFLSGLVSRTPRACGATALANNPKPLSRSPVAYRPPGRAARRLTPRRPLPPTRTLPRAPVRRIYALGQRFVYPPASARPHGCDLTLTATWAISPEITTRAIRAVTAKRFPLCIGGALKAPPQDKH